MLGTVADVRPEPAPGGSPWPSPSPAPSSPSKTSRPSPAAARPSSSTPTPSRASSPAALFWKSASRPARSCTASTPGSASSPRSCSTDDQVRDFQKYLIYNHAAGIGEPCPEDWVRAAMLLRVNVHAHGHSGCRPEITRTLIAMLNAGVTPVVCRKGSVGACGDLAPMSQIALLHDGRGRGLLQGRADGRRRRPRRRRESRCRVSRRGTVSPPSTAPT